MPMRRRIEKRFEKLLKDGFDLELEHRKLSTSVGKDLSEIRK